MRHQKVRPLLESASIDAVTFRIQESCTKGELCAALGLSKAVRGRVLSQGRLVLAGDVATLHLMPASQAVPVSHMPVEVLYRDRFLLVANKPAGLLVHGDGTGAQTLAARVQGYLERLAQEQSWPFVPVAQALNRLDVDTSGIVLFSMTAEFQPAFDAMVADHGSALHKRYLAIVEGNVDARSFTINAPIARDRHEARRMRVGKTGKVAQTRVACLQCQGGRSLVACELLTGRRHQIRVHLASIGHPLVGDALYGKSGGKRSQTGLMLHAYEVAFVHPVSNERIVLHTEWPARFAKLFVPREVDWSILTHE